MKQLSSFSPDAQTLALSLNTLANAVSGYTGVPVTEVNVGTPQAEADLQPELDAVSVYDRARRLGSSGLSQFVVGFTRRQLDGPDGKESFIAGPDTGSLIRPQRTRRETTYFAFMDPMGIETTYALSQAGLLRRYHGNDVLGQAIKGDEEVRILTALQDTVSHRQFMQDVQTARDQQQIRIEQWAARPLLFALQKQGLR